ncbi:MAG: acyltransferase family protein [Pseudotabrizicola sp.]|uniref:acyltransferase family protein n=1 Tax=Pseudotabrizicola sp. TaxID=2939647 RepID=UPI0027158773|nr:acyltransferase family protein [Pseudotabrizicola sp.]MDO9638477.1 acyltransferase family protein [Pseudotabrizicola sp.]
MTRRHTDTTLMLCLATVLITLSHLDAFVPDPRIATGGAIGNSLFFFLSGYGLAMSLNAAGSDATSPSLLAYLGKRLSRLYPAVLIVACAMLATLQIQMVSITDIVAAFVWPTPFWFISAVVVFYVPIFYLARLQPAGIATAMAALLVPYVFFYSRLDLSQFVVEGPDYFKWINYFGITLMGCLVARLKLTPKLSLFTVAALLMSLLLFLVTKLTVFRYDMGHLQFLFHVWLYPIVFFSFHIFSSEAVLKPLRATPLFPVVALLGGLTLEIYLTQTAWIHWLEAQNYDFGHTVLLLMALVPVLVFSVLTQWLSQRLTAGASRVLHKPRVNPQKPVDLT